MKWLRLYHDLPNDPKWRLVAMDSEQPLTAVIAVYISMLCCASAAEERGTLEGWDDRTAGAALNLKGDSVRAIREAMQGLVLDGDKLTGWDKRQRAMDDTAKRTANYRERLHAGTGRKSTPYVAADIFKMDGGACIYCGATEKLCVDHMVPIVCGGDHEQDNLACACRRCNSGKSGRTPEQARYQIISPAARERYMRALARLGVNPHTVKPLKPGEPPAPTTDTHTDAVTVTGADVTEFSEPVTDFPLRAQIQTQTSEEETGEPVCVTSASPTAHVQAREAPTESLEVKSAQVIAIADRRLRPCDPGWTLPAEWCAAAVAAGHPRVEIAERRFRSHWRLRRAKCLRLSLADLRDEWDTWVLEDIERERRNGGHSGSKHDALLDGLAGTFGDCMDAGPAGTGGSGRAVVRRVGGG